MHPSPLIETAFKDLGKTRNLYKKSSLLHQGTVSKSVYFVKSGCLRMCYNDNGNDITIKFFIAGDIVASLDSFYHGKPSKFSIESVIPSSVVSIDKAAFDKMYHDSLELRDDMLSISIACMCDYQDIFLNRIMKTPEERFHWLMENNAILFEIIPHHYIASYLGMTPVSLSRIRNRTKTVNNC